jgi:hypothetical protein
MIHKLFELIAIYVETANAKPVQDNREAKALRKEIECKQTPHLL